MSKCIVNYSSGFYIHCQNRMANRLKELEFNGSTLFFTQNLPRGCAFHKVIPYQFKPFCIWNAYLSGYRQILWLDAPIYPNHSIDYFFQKIAKNGYFVLGDSGWNLGEWCSDRVLDHYRISREDSFKMPQCLSGVLGFDLNRPEVLIIFKRWMDESHITFPGDWDNQMGTVSVHPDVRGHRHDQTSIAILAHQAGWEFTDCQTDDCFFYGVNPKYKLNIYHPEYNMRKA